MIDLFNVYSHSPIWVQNKMCSLQGYFIKKRRLGSGFHSELKKYLHQEYNQRKELTRFLNVAKKVDAYNDIIGNQVIDEDNVYEIIKLFPIINKTVVKNHIKAYTNSHYEGKIIEMRTSGTTGGALIFPYTVKMENKQWAIWWRYRIRLGLQLDTWCGWFGGKKIISLKQRKAPFWRINKGAKQVMFSSDHLTNENANLYRNEIEKRSLTWLHGYPSHIARLSSFIINEGLKPVECVSIVTTGAENILPNQVELIKTAFPNAIVRQHYGLNEGVANISQDINEEWHVDDDFCFVEFIPVSSEEPNVCRIVGTGFSNDAFPLIRYDTGDLATVEWNENGELQRIVSIDGRSSNFIIQPNGIRIGEARLSIFLHDYLCISEAQFHQKSKTDIELWIVKGLGYSDQIEEDIQKKSVEWFGHSMTLTIKYVDKVERTKAGKLKLVINETEI